MDEKTTVQEPKVYAETKPSFFAKVKNGISAHKKGVIIGGVGALLAGAGAVAAKVAASKGGMPIEVPVEEVAEHFEA